MNLDELSWVDWIVVGFIVSVIVSMVVGCFFRSGVSDDNQTGC